jgi:hypothetical protein
MPQKGTKRHKKRTEGPRDNGPRDNGTTDYETTDYETTDYETTDYGLGISQRFGKEKDLEIHCHKEARKDTKKGRRDNGTTRPGTTR